MCGTFLNLALLGSSIWEWVCTFEWFVQLLSFCFWILKATSLLISFISMFLLICWCYLLLVYFLSAIKSMHWTKQAKKNYFTFETNFSLLLAKMTYIDSFNSLQYDFCLSFIFVLSKTESHAFYFALTNFQFSCIFMSCWR